MHTYMLRTAVCDAAAQVVIATVAVFVLQWRLALVMLSVVPIIVLAGGVYARFVKRVAKRYQDCLASASTVASETLGAVRTVRSFARERREAGRYGSAISESYVEGARRALAYGVFLALIGFVGQSAVILVLWYGGTLVLDDRGKPHGFDPGHLMSFLLYTVMIASAMGGCAGLFGTLMNAVGASDRIFQLFDRDSAVVANEHGPRLPRMRGVLEFADVTFAYPTRPHIKVIVDTPAGS